MHEDPNCTPYFKVFFSKKKSYYEEKKNDLQLSYHDTHEFYQLIKRNIYYKHIIILIQEMVFMPVLFYYSKGKKSVPIIISSCFSCDSWFWMIAPWNTILSQAKTIFWNLLEQPSNKNVLQHFQVHAIHRFTLYGGDWMAVDSRVPAGSVQRFDRLVSSIIDVESYDYRFCAVPRINACTCAHVGRRYHCDRRVEDTSWLLLLKGGATRTRDSKQT